MPQLPNRPPPISITLTYVFNAPRRPMLRWVRAGDESIDQSLFRKGDESFKAFQLLFCHSWSFKQGAEESAILCDPEHLVKALYNGLRDDTPYEWMVYIFGDLNKDHYLKAHWQKKKLIAYATDRILDGIKVQEAGVERDPKAEEVAAIIGSIKNDDPKFHSLLTIRTSSPSGHESWTISGRTSGRSLYFGCHVQIHVEYQKRLSVLLFWFSNDRVYELYPEMDRDLSNVPDPRLDHYKAHSEILIGESPGIQIDTRKGVEACLAIFSDQRLDRDKIRIEIIRFLEGNRMTSFQRDPGPTKRYFSGRLPAEQFQHRLANPANRQSWGEYLLQDAMPEGAHATLLTLPLIDEPT